MKETKLRDRIKDLKDNIDIEKVVSKRIQDFIKKKQEGCEKDDKIRNDMREEKVKNLANEKEEIEVNREEADQEMQDFMKKIEYETEQKNRLDADDAANEADEKAKAQEKLDMDAAARYVQRKWDWYQKEGKNLMKKKKKKKGKKKKK
jgi:hypothetical protein